MDPERVERVDLVLRAERVDGVRPDPVRVDAGCAGCAVGAAASPHVSQYPSSTVPVHPGCAHVAMLPSTIRNPVGRAWNIALPALSAHS